MSRTVFTGYTVRVEGLDSLLRWMKDANPKLQRAFKKGLKEAMNPVLERARANAKRIQDDGTYAGSLAVASRKGGAQYVLKSTDPNAGVKEFAKPGAVGRTAKWRGRHVGVPHRANKPRVMVPAVADSADEVQDRIDERLAEVLKEVENG